MPEVRMPNCRQTSMASARAKRRSGSVRKQFFE
jgi:hypothetical protein